MSFTASQIAQIEQMIASNNLAAQAFSDEAQNLEDARLTAINSVSVHVGDLLPSIPMVNIFKDSGRLYDRTALGLSETTQLDNSLETFSEQVSPYNGSAISHAGKFHTNSSSFGGTDIACEPTVVDLLDTMFESDPYRRYGTEFNVGTVTCGAQEVPTIMGDHHLCLGLYTLPTPLLSTFMIWVRCKSGQAAHIDAHRNGVLVADSLLTPADGWVHLAMLFTAASGYLTTTHLYGQIGTEIEFAIPAMVPGDFRGVIHTAPIPSLYGE